MCEAISEVLPAGCQESAIHPVIEESLELSVPSNSILSLRICAGDLPLMRIIACLYRISVPGRIEGEDGPLAIVGVSSAPAMNSPKN